MTIRIPVGSPPVLLSPPAVANGVVYIASGVPSAPAIANGTVYVGGGLRPGTVGVGAGPNMILYALDANSGRELWQFESGDTGGLYALDAATGRERWRFATRGRTNQTAVSGNTVYVGSDDDHLYAVDAATGQERWAFKTGDWVRGAPSIADGVVYVGSDDDTLHAIDAATGRELWHVTGDDPVRDYARSAPAVVGGVVYAGIGRSLYALAAPEPAPVRSPIVAQAARANGVVGSAEPFIGALGQGNGTIPNQASATATLQRALASLALYARPLACQAPVVLVVGHGDTVAAGSRLAGTAIGLLVQNAPGLLRDAAYDAAGVADAAAGQVDLYIYLSGDCGTPGPWSGTPRAGRINS